MDHCCVRAGRSIEKQMSKAAGSQASHSRSMTPQDVRPGSLKHESGGAVHVNPAKMAVLFDDQPRSKAADSKPSDTIKDQSLSKLERTW